MNIAKYDIINQILDPMQPPTSSDVLAVWGFLNLQPLWKREHRKQVYTVPVGAKL